MKRSAAAACGVLAVLALATMARPAPPDTKRSAWLHELYLKDASEYGFALDAAGRNALTLWREPVMRWSSESDYHGDVYVWTRGGRPGVVGCIFSGPQGDGSRSVMHEFHSLSPERLFPTERGASGWEPREPGIRPEPVPGAAEPAATPALRLAEMRGFARRFSAHMSADARDWELRLLPQPIYRYDVPGNDSPVIDGAVFAFVWTVGTDPETLLVLEARRTDAGPRWQYALARFTNREVRVKYGDREVWHVDAATVGIFDGVTDRRYGAFAVKTVTAPR